MHYAPGNLEFYRELEITRIVFFSSCFCLFFSIWRMSRETGFEINNQYIMLRLKKDPSTASVAALFRSTETHVVYQK